VVTFLQGTEALRVAREISSLANLSIN